MKKDLVTWLKEDCKAFDVRPVLVTIEGEIWQAAFYRQTFEYQPGMDAVSRGEKKAGDKYTEEGIYCIGSLPSLYHSRKRNHVCFPWNGQEWFIAGYSSIAGMREPYSEFHPFGPNFMMRPWNIPNSKIDDGEPKPYTRVEMNVSWVFGL